MTFDHVLSSPIVSKYITIEIIAPQVSNDLGKNWIITTPLFFFNEI